MTLLQIWKIPYLWGRRKQQALSLDKNGYVYICLVHGLPRVFFSTGADCLMRKNTFILAEQKTRQWNGRTLTFIISSPLTSEYKKCQRGEDFLSSLLISQISIVSHSVNSKHEDVLNLVYVCDHLYTKWPGYIL